MVECPARGWTLLASQHQPSLKNQLKSWRYFVVESSVNNTAASCTRIKESCKKPRIAVGDTVPVKKPSNRFKGCCFFFSPTKVSEKKELASYRLEDGHKWNASKLFRVSERRICRQSQLPVPQSPTLVSQPAGLQPATPQPHSPGVLQSAVPQPWFPEVLQLAVPQPRSPRVLKPVVLQLQFPGVQQRTRSAAATVYWRTATWRAAAAVPWRSAASCAAAAFWDAVSICCTAAANLGCTEFRAADPKTPVTGLAS